MGLPLSFVMNAATPALQAFLLDIVSPMMNPRSPKVIVNTKIQITKSFVVNVLFIQSSPFLLFEFTFNLSRYNQIANAFLKNYSSSFAFP